MHQFEQRTSIKDPIKKAIFYKSIPRLPFICAFSILGLISINFHREDKSFTLKYIPEMNPKRKMYCQITSALLYFFAVRNFLLMFISDEFMKVILGDFTAFLNQNRAYYLMPLFLLGIQGACISSIFLTKERELTWLLPFISVSDNQNNDNYADPTRNHKRRLFLWKFIGGLMMIIFVSLFSYLIYEKTLARLNTDSLRLWIPWMVLHFIWIFYLISIKLSTLAYFNFVCITIEKRFAEISKEIEMFAESETTIAKNSDLIRLYFNHNELCELVEESNSFWQYYLFYTAVTYIPCACFSLYTLFFATLDIILILYLTLIFSYSLVVLAVICISAADVSSEAHSPYTSLHTLSLLQLPIDLEVNMSTFLHRIRGPTIGFSCMDLFVITNASISSTLASIASYFLIIADFSRTTISFPLSSTNYNSSAPKTTYIASNAITVMPSGSN